MAAHQDLKPFVHALLDDAAARWPDSPAVTDAAGTWSYRELAARSHAVARWFLGRGIGPGQRVVAQLRSERELVAMFFALSRLGAVFVPLNPDMKPYHLSPVLANADPALVVTATAAVPAMARLTAVPVSGLDVLRAEADGLGGSAVDSGSVAAGDIAVLIYTSGSTAAPKAVVCPHAQMTFASRAIQAELGYRPEDVVLCRFPLSWDYGLYKTLLCCLGGSELVLADAESDLLLLRRMHETGTTIVPLVPSLAEMILALARRDTGPRPPIRMFTNTGAALSPATIAALRELFPASRVVRQYGQTESKRISVMPPGEDGERPASVGRPLPGTTVRILGPDGEELPAGETGEIVVHGPHVMPGYWRAPEVTARTFRRDPRTGELRLHTGDYGSLDADGYLYFDGRRDDMFKRKGIRMSTLEIEAAAMDVPGVRSAAALPPTDRYDLTLFVVGGPEPAVLLRELAARLEPAKVPAACRALAELPLTANGKYSRAGLTALLDAGTG